MRTDSCAHKNNTEVAIQKACLQSHRAGRDPCYAGEIDLHFVAHEQKCKYKQADYLKTPSHVSSLEPLSLDPDERSNSCTVSGFRMNRFNCSATFCGSEVRTQLWIYAALSG